MVWEFIKPEKKPTGLPKLSLRLDKDGSTGYVHLSTAAVAALEIDLKDDHVNRMVGFARNDSTRGMYVVAKVKDGFLLGTNQRINHDSLRRDICRQFNLDPAKKHVLLLDLNVVTKADGCKAILITKNDQ